MHTPAPDAWPSRALSSLADKWVACTAVDGRWPERSGGVKDISGRSARGRLGGIVFLALLRQVEVERQATWERASIGGHQGQGGGWYGPGTEWTAAPKRAPGCELSSVKAATRTAHASASTSENLGL